MQRRAAATSARANAMSVAEYSEIRIVEGETFGSQAACVGTL